MTEAQNSKPNLRAKASSSIPKTLAVLGNALVAVIVVLVNYISVQGATRRRGAHARSVSSRCHRAPTKSCATCRKPVDIYWLHVERRAQPPGARELLTRCHCAFKTGKLTVHTR